jgi:iron complex outermembrane receptor protein
MFKLRRAVLTFAFIATTPWLPAQSTEQKEKTKTEENIVVMEKFVAGESNDPSGVLPPPNEMFGLSKAVVDIPRSVSTVSGDMVEKFNINELVDMARFVPSTYTTFSFGIQGGLSVRGGNGDAYYRDMKRINNGPNMPTLIGASDGVDIVRGPPSSVYGAGQVGGYMNYKPKSARASTGRYLDSQTGKISTTFGSWGKRSGTAEIGGPLKIFGKRAGYYAYGQIDNSDSYYIGSFSRNHILQATLTIDLSDNFRLETGINYQNFHGTGLAGWSRVTQDLIDNQNYVSGLPARNLDANGDGLVSFMEIYSLGNLNITIPASGLKPNLTPASMFGLDPATVQTVKLSPRNVLLEKDAFGRDYIFFVDLVNDKNPNLIFRNKIFVERQSHEKASDIAYYREHEAFVAEERFTVEWHPTFLPEWLKLATVTAANVRYLDTYNGSTNIHQIFNYWDLTRFTDGNYGFANGLHHPELANYQGRIGSSSKSQHVEAGAGVLVDITAFKRLNLTVGSRLDTVYGRVQNFPGFSVSNLSTNASGANSGNAITLTNAGFFKGSDRKYSLTSASLSYALFKGIRPYVTYAQPRTLIPGASGGLSSGTLNSREILQPSELKEAGIKGEFFGGRLFVGVSTFYQFRSSYNVTLEEYINTISDGTDVEIRWVPTRKFNISAAIDWIRRRTSPPSAAGVQVPPATAGYDFLTQGLGRYNITLPAAANERSYQPAQVWSVFANYTLGHGFDVSLGTSRQSSFPSSNLHDIMLPSAQTFSGSIGYTSRKWDVRVSGKNLTDVLYFQANSGSAGPIPNVGRSIDCKVTWKY